MNTLIRTYRPHCDRLIANARRAYQTAHNEQFKKYWLDVLHYLQKTYGRLN